MVDIAEFIKLAATDFENSGDYIREKVTAICDKYPLYK
jgi:glycine hydroxymethyltransferase